MKIGIIYNPAAGKKSATKKDIIRAFKTHQTEHVFFDISEGTQKIIANARRERSEIIVAAGGDGTVNCAATVAIKLKIPLGVLPVGTLNHFAKDADLPIDLEEATKTIASNKHKKVDYCSVNGNIFLNNSNIGMYPATVANRSRLEDKIGKWPAAFWAFSKTLLKINTLMLEIQIMNDSTMIRTPLLFVGNNSYDHQRMGLADRKSLDSGHLFLYVVRANRYLAIMRTFVSFLFGRRLRTEDFVRETSEKIIVDAKRQYINVSLDGEVKRLATPLVYEIHPKALTVMFNSNKI